MLIQRSSELLSKTNSQNYRFKMTFQAVGIAPEVREQGR